MSELDDWVGRTTTASSVVDAEQANRMTVTLDREPTFEAGDTLPPAWHWLYFHDLVRASRLGEEGHPALGVTMPPVSLPRRMWASGSFEFAEPIRLGTEVTRRSTIASIVPKEGRSGPLCFVTVEHELQTDGVRNLLERQTIVYREMSVDDPAPVPPDAPRLSTSSHTWQPDSTMLFRYSALTFNGHRIHYDADYARGTEGYPGLVVHGPLLATLLLDLAVESGIAVNRFSYKARNPVFLPQSFATHAQAGEGASASLWVLDDTGRVSMTATVDP